jgi:hypothetical protein
VSFVTTAAMSSRALCQLELAGTTVASLKGAFWAYSVAVAAIATARTESERVNDISGLT